MLVHLAAALAPLGADLRAIAVDRAISALFDTDKEVTLQLDRIETKLDAVKNKDAANGWQYLNQALEPHRCAAEKKNQVSLALEAFVSAASSASDDAMSRSIARIYQAVCWSCLGSPEDVRRRVSEARMDAYDAVYQAAVKYNAPQRTAMEMGGSWRQRHTPGWEATDPKAARRAETGKASAMDRFMKSGLTKPARQIQLRVQPLLDQVNVWSMSVTDLDDQIQRPALPWAKRRMTQCHVFADSEPGKAGRARVKATLKLGATIDVHGIAISFLDGIPETIGGVEYIDVLLRVNFASYSQRERATYSPQPWCVLNQTPSRRFDGPVVRADPVLKPRAADTSADQWLMGDITPGVHANGFRVGPGFMDEASGWRRFRRTHDFTAVELVPAGPLWPLLEPRDPRPSIAVGLTE